MRESTSFLLLALIILGCWLFPRDTGRYQFHTGTSEFGRPEIFILDSQTGQLWMHFNEGITWERWEIFSQLETWDQFRKRYDKQKEAEKQIKKHP